MDLNMALIKADILMAKQGIAIYDERGIREIKNMAAYHLQQAAEKLIKIQVYKSGVEYSNKEMYVHNLVKLISYSRKIGIDISVPREIDNNAITITDWEAGSRYDLHFSIRIDTLKNMYDVIEKWYMDLYTAGIR